MSRRHRITGLNKGTVDTGSNSVTFQVAIRDAAPMTFIADAGPMTQLVGGLGRMFLELRRSLHGTGAMKDIPTEAVASSHVQKDRAHNVILMQLTTPQGVPYTFAMSPQAAIGIADQLTDAAFKASPDALRDAHQARTTQ